MSCFLTCQTKCQKLTPLLTHIPSRVVSTDRYSLDDLLSKVSWLYGVMQMIDTEYNEIDRRLPV